ncbi:MAG: AraC family transcriptional regulator [Cyanobacteriota bacterium]|nr:AraC family transcriptional regulator [Cyanobacteriota bacterium]
MSSTRKSEVEPAKPNPSLLPYSPIVSSHSVGWENLQLALFQMPSHRIPEHRPTYHTICINYGKPVQVELSVDGKPWVRHSYPTDVCIFPANLWQSFQWQQEVTFLDLFFEQSLLTQTGRELFEYDQVELIPILQTRFDPLIYEMANALKASLERDPSASKLYGDTMANALAVHLLTHYSNHKLTPKKHSQGLSEHQLKRVITHMHDCLDQDLRLSDLARLIHLSPYHFARLFKQATGMAPHRYHIQCRIDRAKQLLKARELSLAEIATSVGFASQGHLNYHFKQHVGLTPKAFLRQ